QRIAGYPWAVLSAGTDGIDGNSPAAGAIVDGDTVTLAEHKGLSPERFLADFDSHGFFKEMEARCGQSFLVESGPTGTNVNDIMLWWITPA
ncbi:MAG: glycerate kinase, partial [Dehalococcoidia bacterium]|nr:glycerate kinase [Dehalococcoidia bacterium]